MIENFNVFQWVVLPFLIFLARLVDVSLQTLRIIFISKGKRYLAPLLGFFEVFIWIVAVSSLVKNLANVVGYLAYAAGFALGSYVGLLVEERLALGYVMIRAILPDYPDALISRLREAGYGVTLVDGEGSHGPVKLIYTMIRRKNLAEVSGLIRGSGDHVFFTVEELRTTSGGIFPPSNRESVKRLSVMNRK